MKTFSEFITESEQQSGALAAHLARTAADRASQSGTVGGTEKKFVKRPSLGLKRPTLPSLERKDEIKDKGPRKPAPYGSGPRPQKALPGSRDDVQKVNVKVEKPAEKKPALKPAADRPAIKPAADRPALKPASSSTSIAKRSSQSIRNAGKNTAGSVQKVKVRVEPQQRPALQPAAKRPALRPAAERGKLKPAASRPALPPGSGKPISPMIRAAAKQAALKAAQQRKALPASNQRALPPARS